MDLVPVLQRALLQHHPKPCYSRASPYVRYVEDMLFRDDPEEEEGIQQNCSASYDLIFGELRSLISPARAVPLKLSNPDFRCLLLEGARAVVAKDASRVHDVVGRVQGVSRETQSAIAQGNLTERSSPFEVIYLHFADALVAKLAGTGLQLREIIKREAPKVDIRLLHAINHGGRSLYIFTQEMILTHCKNIRRLHIVEFGGYGGYQWPYLLRTLAERRRKSLEYIKITSINFTEPTLKVKLLDYAKSLGLTVYFEAIGSRSWDEVRLSIASNEVLIVTCYWRMMHVTNPNVVLERIFRLKPFMFIQCEFGPTIDNPFFLMRFEVALRHYEAIYSGAVGWPKLSEDVHVQIMDIVACEGGEREDKRTSYKCWDERARRAGFEHMEVPQDIINKVSGYIRDPRRGCEMSWPMVKVNGETLCRLFAWKPATYPFHI